MRYITYLCVMAEPKSKARKNIAGTSRPDRETTPIPPADFRSASNKLPADFPDPPSFLSRVKEGNRIYFDLARHANSVKELWAIDVYIVGQAAYWLALCEQTINDSDGTFIQTFSTGAQQISPKFQIIDKAEQHIKKYFDMLGIGIKSREGIGAFSNGKGEESGGDAFSAFMERIEKTRTVV